MARPLLRLTHLSLVPIAAIALAVAAAVDATLGSTDTLPQQIATTLAQVPQRCGGIDIVTHSSGAIADGARGLRIGLLTLAFAGIPAAIVAAALRLAKRGCTDAHWPHASSNLFAAGLVFQLSSLALTSLLLAVTNAVVVVDPYVTVGDAAPAVGVLLFCSTCSAWGLRSWRTLQLTAYEEPLRITAP